MNVRVRASRNLVPWRCRRRVVGGSWLGGGWCGDWCLWRRPWFLDLFSGRWMDGWMGLFNRSATQFSIIRDLI